MIKNTLGKTLILCSLLTLALTACESTDESPSTSSGSGVTLESLAKSWTSSCLTGSDATTGADRYKVTFTLGSGGTFNWNQAWYAGSCVGGNYRIIYSSSGTYSIGSAVSGSTTLQELAFTVTSSSMMAFTTTVQDSVHTACGGTSPYPAGGDASLNGHSPSTYMMTCFTIDLPNSTDKFVDNIASLSGGVLSIGVNGNGIPGVFQGNSVPTTATLDFY